MAVPQDKLNAFRGVLQNMIDDGASEDVINEATAKFKEKYDVPISGGQAGGMGDVKLAENPPPDKSSIFPSAIEEYQNRFYKPSGSIGQSLKDVAAVGAAGAGDLSSLLQRGAAGAFTDQETSTPGAHFLKNSTDAAVAKAQADLSAHPELNDYIPPGGFGGIPMMMPTPSMAPSLTEQGGRIIDDPTYYGSLLLKTLSYIPQIAGVARAAVVPGLKNYVSSLSQIDKPLLERAATPEGLAALQQAAKTTPEELGTQIATDVGKVNDSRQSLMEGSQANQQARYERDLLNARQTATGAQSPSIASIRPGESGEAINAAVEAAKKPMQEAWVAGDRGSVGPLRDNPAATIIKRGVGGRFYKSKELTGELADILQEHKALSPSDGVRNISKGAAGAIKSVIGLSDQGGHTIDDLLNIRAELRRVRTGEGFEGNPFDKSTDDLVFGKADAAVNRTLNKSILKADPQQGPQIVRMMNAKDAQYGQAKDYLGELAGSLGKTRNSTAVIEKVKQMGPQRAREFIAAAQGNPAVSSVVPALRQGFVDDLLLSSVKGGDFSGAEFAKRWADPKLQEIKQAWLDPEVIAEIDDAVKRGSLEISEPGKVGESFLRKGSPDALQAAQRVGNIGIANPVNQRAMADLQMLDKINGTDYAQRAQQIFEGKKLGLGADGKLAIDPLHSTGARGYATQKGRVVGGIAGGLLGWFTHQTAGAAGGTALGALAGDMIAGAHTYAASPAGAVASFRKLNTLLESKYPRAARLARAFDKTSSVAAKARIGAQIASELQAEMPSNVIPFRKVAQSPDSTQYTAN